MAEYMDLNEDSKEEQRKHAEVLRRFEAQKRARSIIVPTAIPDVKARLRELQQPITLFGEGPADRRERLREEIAKLELDQEQLDKLQEILSNNAAASAANLAALQQGAAQGATMTTMQEQLNKPGGQSETFYSPALEELIAARNDICEFSFTRAQQRLKLTKEIRSTELLSQDHDRMVFNLYEHSMEVVLNTSQVADDRPLTATKYSADGKLVATGALSSVVKLWSTDMLENSGVLRNASERITSLAWHPQSHGAAESGAASLLAASSADGCCYICDINRCISALAKNSEGFNSSSTADAAMAVDADEAATHNANDSNGSSKSSTIRDGVTTNSNDATAFNPSLHSLVHKLSGHRGPATACAFHPSGRYLASAGADSTWRLWDVNTGQQLLLQDGHTSDCSAISFHPDGSLLVSADSSGVIHVWDLRSGQSVFAVAGHVKKITAASCSATGHQFATSSVDNTVKIWDLRRKKCHYTLPAHANIITDVKYSASGEALLTSSFDGTLKLWGARDFRILRTLAGHSGKVMSADFAPDEKHIVSGGYDRTVKIWAHMNEF